MIGYGQVSEADRRAFWADGYLFKRGYLSSDEVALANETIRTDPSIRSHALAINDNAGGSTELALWNHPSDDVFGAIARCERIAGGAERLMGGEVYHYHSKLTMKRPGGGGRWEWHQDYGYWYQNGCLYPDMLSVAVAIDRATRENGCMQVLRGSHKLGRIEHGRSPARPAPTSSGSSRRSRSSTWSIARWSRAMRCSSTATPCTARRRTCRPAAATC